MKIVIQGKIIDTEVLRVSTVSSERVEKIKIHIQNLQHEFVISDLKISKK
jgi:hypothetical protein